jgi:hypothetical protein
VPGAKLSCKRKHFFMYICTVNCTLSQTVSSAATNRCSRTRHIHTCEMDWHVTVQLKHMWRVHSVYVCAMLT